jgi:predicted enzyme related to lactoylglutathione lyase
MADAGTGIGRISLVCLPTRVERQDEAIKFYESIGFEKRTDIPMGDGYRWVEVYPPDGAAGIALAPPPPGSDVTPAETGITLTTGDISTTHAAFKAAGADVDAEVTRMGGPVPPMFWFHDPSGHHLMVVENP